MRKAITPIIAIIILVLITVAVVGLGYGFISGVLTATTARAALVSGMSTCINGVVNITITNIGTSRLTSSDIVITRTDGTSLFQPLAPDPLPLQATGTVGEAPGSICGAGKTCTYQVAVGGTLYPTRAACA